MDPQDTNNRSAAAPTIINNNYGNIGAQINHVDHFHAVFDKDMGLSVDGCNLMDAAQDAAKSRQDSPDREWIAEILPCFFGIEEAALEFVRIARAVKKPTEITALANAWIRQQRISPVSCKRPLWKPLHDHGVYANSEACWNTQVDSQRVK